jgi:hypothetical protein
LQGDHPEIVQSPAHLRPIRRRRFIRSTPWRLPTRRRQHQFAAPLQADKPFAAGHLLQRTIEELQADLDAWLVEYNHRRPHQGRWCFGNTPMQTFLDTLPLAKEKLMAA